MVNNISELIEGGPPSFDPLFVASKKILHAYETRGFFCGIVEGPQGIGKSSYSLKVFHDIFRCLGFDDTVAWNMALDRCLYHMDEIIAFIDNSIRSPDIQIGLIWDDAGVFASNLDWFINVKRVKHLQGMMDTVRTALGGVLLTCPNQGQLLKFLRRYDNYIIQIGYDGRGGWYRVAKGYVKRTLPSGTVRVYPRFRDYYRCYLPKWVYDKYSKKREQYTIYNVDQLKKIRGV